MGVLGLHLTFNQCAQQGWAYKKILMCDPGEGQRHLSMVSGKKVEYFFGPLEIL